MLNLLFPHHYYHLYLPFTAFFDGVIPNTLCSLYEWSLDLSLSFN